jgi:hypothetical protein
VKQIIQGKKEFKDPPNTAEEYEHWQVVRVKLQWMVHNNELRLSELIIFNEETIFNPRRISGDVALYVHFRYRGLSRKLIQIYSSQEDLSLIEIPADPTIPEFKDKEICIPRDILQR